MRKFKDGVCLFQEGVLHHHGEMGHQHQTGRHLVEPRSEQLHPDAVWSYNRNLHQGETETKEVKFCALFCSLFFKNPVLWSLETWRWERELVAQTGTWWKGCMRVRSPVNNQKKHRPTGLIWRSGGCFLSPQNEPPLFSKDGHKFFFTRAIPQGGRGKFFHISMSTFLVKTCRSSQRWRLPSVLTF